MDKIKNRDLESITLNIGNGRTTIFGLEKSQASFPSSQPIQVIPHSKNFSDNKIYSANKIVKYQIKLLYYFVFESISSQF